MIQVTILRKMQRIVLIFMTIALLYDLRVCDRAASADYDA